MHHLIRMTGVVIALALLLAVFVSPAQASEMVHNPVEDSDQVDDTALICLALVGSTAIMAGGLWMGKLQRILS